MLHTAGQETFVHCNLFPLLDYADLLFMNTSDQYRKLDTTVPCDFLLAVEFVSIIVPYIPLQNIYRSLYSVQTLTLVVFHLYVSHWTGPLLFMCIH